MSAKVICHATADIHGEEECIVLQFAPYLELSLFSTCFVTFSAYLVTCCLFQTVCFMHEVDIIVLVVAFCAFPCRLLKIREENLVQVDICVHVGMGGLLVFFWNFQFFVSTSFIIKQSVCIQHTYY